MIFCSKKLHDWGVGEGRKETLQEIRDEARQLAFKKNEEMTYKDQELQSQVICHITYLILFVPRQFWSFSGQVQSLDSLYYQLYERSSFSTDRSPQGSYQFKNIPKVICKASYLSEKARHISNKQTKNETKITIEVI